MDKLEKGEIIYGNITISYKQNKKDKTITLNDEILARKYECDYPNLDNKLYSGTLRKIDKKNKGDITDMKVIDVKIKARTGFIAIHNGYTEVKRSDEKRNKITGAYE